MKEKTIGIFDSGLGGLAIVRQVLNRIPEENVVYFADFAHLPYGPRPEEEVRNLVRHVIAFFLEKDVKMILIGCNTASAIAAREAQQKAGGIPVIGMIEPAVNATLADRHVSRIGVIGTLGTVKSGAYDKAFRQASPSLKVFSHACPELIRLAEQGIISDKSRIRALAKECIGPLEKEGIDILVLGCTDLTCIAKELQVALPPDIKIVDPASEVAKSAYAVLQRKGWRCKGEQRGHINFFASAEGPQGAREFAQQAFGICIEGFKTVSLK